MSLFRRKRQKYFLTNQPKPVFWVPKRTASLRRFFWVPTTYVWMRNKENSFPIRTLIWSPDLCIIFKCACVSRVSSRLHLHEVISFISVWDSFNKPTRPLAGYGLPPPPQGEFVDHIFLEAQCLARILQHVSPLTMAALSCNSLLRTLPYKIFDN